MIAYKCWSEQPEPHIRNMYMVSQAESYLKYTAMQCSNRLATAAAYANHPPNNGHLFVKLLSSNLTTHMVCIW